MTKKATAEEIQLPDEMDLPDALAFAVRMHREGRIELAEEIYRRILAAVPDHPDALHFLGVARYARGARDEAIALIRQAIAVVPGFADYHLNLGNILVEAGQVDEALAEYEEARRLRPDYADAWNNLGSLYRFRDRWDEAEAAYEHAIALDPRHAGAYNNLGMLARDRGDIRKSTEFFCKSIVLEPEHPDGYKLLGVAYSVLGEREKAAEVFRKWVESDPDNPSARHYYAACTGIDVPERATDEYVAHTFDRFANSFEDLLQTKLQYRAPALIAQSLEAHLPAAAKQLDVLDAGCGTGLCGPLIAPWSKCLVGVDLSRGMLDQARAKNCYQQLEKAELTQWLQTHPASYDLIISADTLCYFGALESVSRAAAQALRPGGLLAYTVERLTDPQAGEGHRLSLNGRYTHTRDYVDACLTAAGFTERQIEDAHLRTEGGVPVEGLVVIARRPAG